MDLGLASARRNQLADAKGALAADLKGVDDSFGVFRRDDRDHADTAIEGAQHLVRIETALAGQPGKQGWQGPGREIDLAVEIVGKNPRQIFGEATAGNVGKT